MVSISPDLFAALIAAMFGGGGLFALVLKWLEAKRNHPVNELTSLAEVQKQIREEVRLENAGLRKEISSLRVAMVKLTQILDEVLPKIEGLSDDQKSKLHEANTVAKLAV